MEFSVNNNLLISGGSDFHGVIKADLRNFGKYFIGKEDVDKMRSKLSK
jgi:hypothetical protein